MLKLKEENKNNKSYDLNGDIIFSNVNIFAESKLVLKDLNFLIKQGEKVAIIGDNGSGKSLLSKAILGFNDYSGKIYINNHNIHRLNKSNIREYVDLVEGDTYLFKSTIIDNILLDNKKDTKVDLVEETLKNCEIYDEVNKFKNKENTQIGENGVKLSGGQKQRISIARTLLKGKPIIIFDESLNKIDNFTKEKILINLINNYNQKTMIFITHDLKLVEYVDKVIYIDNNTTIVGKHNELLIRNSRYKNYQKIEIEAKNEI